MLSAADTVLDKAWSDIQPPDFIRWVTPRFVKYGRVLKHADRSLLVQLLDEDRPRAIPDAKWYYSQFKLRGPNTEEHLCVVQYRPEHDGPPVVLAGIPEAEYAQDVWITASQAAEFLNWDEKQVRRYIRSGKIEANKRDGRWIIHRERLRDAAAKHGWV